MRKTIMALALAAAAVAAAPAQATVYAFEAVLSGLNEDPVNASPATGLGRITFDDVALTMLIQVRYEGLLGPNVAAHLHAATELPFAGNAPVATVTPTFTGFPSGTTSGSYIRLFDLTSNATYRTGYRMTFPGGDATLAGLGLLQAAKDGKSYLNIHSTVFTGGEIRGFLQAAVPEPSTWGLMIAGFGLAGGALRARRRAAV